MGSQDEKNISLITHIAPNTDRLSGCVWSQGVIHVFRIGRTALNNTAGYLSTALSGEGIELS